MIEIQLVLLFVSAMTFSIFFELSTESIGMFVWGAVCAVNWWLFALTWLYTQSLPYIAYFPFILGVAYAARTLHALIGESRRRRFGLGGELSL